MDTFKCKECSEEFKKDWLFKKHVTQKHFPYPEYVIKHNYKSIHPTCKCGCGEKTKYDSAVKDFRKFVHGHLARTKNNWSKDSPYFEKSTKRSAATRRKQYKTGTRKVWNNGVTKNDNTTYGKTMMVLSKKISENKDRSKKISIALTGKPKSPEHIKKIKRFQKEYWADQNHRDEQRKKRIHWLMAHQKEEPSILENNFAELLKNGGIFAKRQFVVEYHLFDFKIGKKILIEVDGDFYHCNPNLGIVPKYKTQQLTIKNDKRKNEIAKKYGYKLLRFWEHDIKTDPKPIIKMILKELKNQI
jgi:very-short-patch-repair endonuclease